MTWKEIRNGFGLEPVPSGIAVQCRFCDQAHNLFATQSTQSDGTSAGYEKMLDRLHNNVYCKVHAEWWFNDVEEDVPWVPNRGFTA